MTAIIDLDEVRRALTVRAVLDAYAHPVKRSGRTEVESSACPRRPDHSRRAFTANLSTNLWRCFPCSIGGDALRLVAEFERLSDRDDFPAVLARGAEIAGVGPSTLSLEERSQRARMWQLERERKEAQERALRIAQAAAAIPRATSYWQQLPTRNPAGEAYLRERGVIAALDLDILRFDPRHEGSPTIALHTRDGQIRNVVRRRMPELGEPKTPGLPACPTAGTLVGSLVHLAGEVVVTEGMIDTVTAKLAWPKASVLGAHGAGNLASIVRAVAPMVSASQARLLLVPHNDDAGRENFTMAAIAAVEAGLSVERNTLAIVRHGEKDLNDAWRRGWRP